MERERGITIQSAVVTFNWQNHDISLIDTPGHVDFTMEVERSVRVLDGAVTVIDSSAGVQAQTFTVWRQAKHFGVPAIFFLNKMDKAGSNLERNIDSIEHKLGVKVLPVVMPHYKDGHLHKLINLLDCSQLVLDNNKEQWTAIEKKSSVFDEYLRQKETLCYGISEFDPGFMDNFLNKHEGDVTKIYDEDIRAALRKITIDRKAATLSCGTALRSTQSVRPLLDQIIHFLPSPEEQHPEIIKLMGQKFSGLLFKITHNKRKNRNSYIRIYSGSLKTNSSIFNTNQSRVEGPLKLFKPWGEELEPCSQVNEGEIVVATGLVHSITGDTLLQSEQVASEIGENLRGRLNAYGDLGESPLHIKKHISEYPVFSGIDAPEPVFFCSVEPPDTKSTHDFERALQNLCKEDPSLRVRVDNETDQTIIETMGELHMEVVKHKLVSEYGLNVFVGPLQVAYKEILKTPSITQSAKIQEPLDEKRVQWVEMEMFIQYKTDVGKFKLKFDLGPECHFIRPDWQKALSEGCQNALHNGPLIGYPVHNVEITIKNLVASGGKINSALLSACAHKCLMDAFAKAEMTIAEPVMAFEITLPMGESSQQILSELTRHRAAITNNATLADESHKIEGRIPLSECLHLSRSIRVLSSGHASLNMELEGYELLSEHERDTLIGRIKAGRA
ncbi:hypothetical protein WR25_08819 isoform B [Diploscapter pachys]|nr:hypothetical protein WR25_08819 isoform B [Diploscapter pachys]